MLRRDQIRIRTSRLFLQAALALAVLIVLSTPRAAVAQHHGGGPGGGFGGGMPGGAHDFPRSGDMSSGMDRDGNMRPHANLQVGPPGRWWDDKHFAKQLKLTQDQQRRMDAIFEQERPVLLNRLDSLQREEQRMEVLTHSKTLDESALFSQIDRIEQARADLFKATMHYQLQIRNELGADQVARLEGQH
jgi:Spy/CpxP family protein refolding chaperone